VERIFSASLAHVDKTELEIRRLVQAFLNARSAVMPGPLRPPRTMTKVDSEESQGFDEYETLDLCDDDELRAALGEDIHMKKTNDNKAKDELVCKVADGVHLFILLVSSLSFVRLSRKISCFLSMGLCVCGSITWRASTLSMSIANKQIFGLIVGWAVLALLYKTKRR
jgi:hypothetical protein